MIFFDLKGNFFVLKFIDVEGINIEDNEGMVCVDVCGKIMFFICCLNMKK